MASLIAFLRKDTFDLELKALTVTIPKNLPQGPVAPEDPLQVHHRSQGEKPVDTVLSFHIDKNATVEEARERRYRFNLEKGEGKLIFKPGDQFDAHLPA